MECQWGANGRVFGSSAKFFFAEICVRSHLAIPAVFFKYPLFFIIHSRFIFFFFILNITIIKFTFLFFF